MNSTYNVQPHARKGSSAFWWRQFTDSHNIGVVVSIVSITGFVKGSEDCYATVEIASVDPYSTQAKTVNIERESSSFSGDTYTVTEMKYRAGDIVDSIPLKCLFESRRHASMFAVDYEHKKLQKAAESYASANSWFKSVVKKTRGD